MFSTETYTDRRRTLLRADAPSSGLIVLLGNEPCAMNYRANPYPFRQDSTFLYYFGLDVPGLEGVIDLDEGETVLYGDDPTLDDVVWMGESPSMQEYAERVGVRIVSDRSALADDLATAQNQGRPVHFLPPYRETHYHRIGQLLGLRRDRIDEHVSAPLVRTVVRQRLTKSEEEVAELEDAVALTGRMHEQAMREAAPGKVEREIAGAIAGMADAHGRGLSFRPTCSIHGEVLHNHDYSNTLQGDDLLLVDAGAQSKRYYAGDITRVTPVDGQFTPRQKAIYTAVLDAQTAAIDAIEPGVPYRDVHLLACRILTARLIDIGLMQGNVDDAVDAGAHALFFPHGLGHMLGLDTHEMENLGEDVVGYAEHQDRSEQFGLHTLRLARPLEPGHVLTIEPGCYFIPELIDRWRSEGRHTAFINYDAVSDFRDFGGVRIEDDVYVTSNGRRVLGPGIPKSVDAVETRASAGIEA